MEKAVQLLTERLRPVWLTNQSISRRWVMSGEIEGLFDNLKNLP
jgi:hypothetical protein